MTVERIRRGVALPESIREQLPPIRIQQFAFPLALLTMIVIGCIAYPQFRTAAK